MRRFALSFLLADLKFPCESKGELSPCHKDASCHYFGEEGTFFVCECNKRFLGDGLTCEIMRGNGFTDLLLS